MVSKVFFLLPLAVSALSLGGCAQAPARATGPVVPVVAPGQTPPRAVMPPPPVTVVISPAEPPELKSEFMGTAPLAGQVWVSGYWYWQTNQYVWIPGHWETPPQPGLVWVPHNWTPVQGGWRLMGGFWQR